MYSQAGTYTVALTVVSQGNASTKKASITVTAAPAGCGFYRRAGCWKFSLVYSVNQHIVRID